MEGYWIALIAVMVILCIVLLFLLLKLYLKLSAGWDRSPTCLVGKTVVVTGSNTGIGLYTALDFAKRGARVVLACRDPHRAEEAKKKIVEATGNQNVVVKIVDLGSLDSIRKFAKEFKDTEERLDILVNNAGAGGFEHTITADGMSLSMQINHFGPFLLTLLVIGIGFYTAQDFAKRGARVILACRNAAKAQEAKKQIIEATSNPNVVVQLVDFASLASVRKFAKEINNSEKRLNILVNNAGVGAFSDKKSDDGLNLLMQVNYFGPFLLTLLLLDLLKKSAPSRIVNVSSIASLWAKLDPNDLNAFPKGKFSTAINYANSKLCNVLFTNELARKLHESGVTANCLHPGIVRTEIFRRTRGFFKVTVKVLGSMFFKTSEEGAQTSIYLAVSKNLEGVTGQYFADCRSGWLPPMQAQDEGLAKKLWEKSVELVKLTPEECRL